jgi:hypothetical protein
LSTLTSLAQWNPGLNDTTTLRAAYEQMPGDDASAIPWYVRLLENPSSPVAFPGAIDLFGHDCIHILLGRGTLSPDEAFVLGVTMGASGKLAAWQQQLFTLSAHYLYRSVFKFSRTDCVVFDVAVDFAKNARIRPLDNVPWRELRDRTLGELRASMNIDTDKLITVYEAERALWPMSPAAQRLPQEVLHLENAHEG